MRKQPTPSGCECNKGKTVLLQAWSGPEGSRKLRFFHECFNILHHYASYLSSSNYSTFNPCHAPPIPHSQHPQKQLIPI